MRSDLVTSRRDRLDHRRLPLRHPAQREERTLGRTVREQLQKAAHISRHSALQGAPSFPDHMRRQGVHLELLFDVNCEVVVHHEELV